MKTGRELEDAIVQYVYDGLGPDDTEGLARYEIVSFFADAPWQRRLVEQALVRIEKKGKLHVERETDPNGIPHYHHPQGTS